MLRVLSSQIWEEEQVARDWKGYLIDILKKGELSKCENNRGVKLPDPLVEYHQQQHTAGEQTGFHLKRKLRKHSGAG